MFDDLAASGVQIVTNDPLPPNRVGLIGQQTISWDFDEFLHAIANIHQPHATVRRFRHFPLQRCERRLCWS